MPDKFNDLIHAAQEYPDCEQMQYRPARDEL